LTEIQQTSDITYRIYDWDRLDPKGMPRELHTLQAMDAIDFEVYDQYRTHYVKQLNQPVPLVSSPYFNTNLLEVTKPVFMDYGDRDSFTVYLCVGGSAELVCRDGRIRLSGGDAILIPAEIPDGRILPAPSATLLETYVEPDIESL
ncbi:MAG TPA: AraC family ligand binding domain-containing protein, partial [Bacteroidales bacterium]|nr:AraC family ligand binding domain-containing protein [Bacteroidales bacterium]